MPFIIRRAIILSETQIASGVIKNYHIADNEINYTKLNPLTKALLLINL